MGIVSLIKGAYTILSLLIDCGRSEVYPSFQWTRHNPNGDGKRPELQPGKDYYFIATDHAKLEETYQGATPGNRACGRGPITKVVGGKEAKRGDHPWHGLLEKDGNQFCGGTLIEKKWLITAAHCVEDENAENINVRMGAIYRVDKPSTSQGEQKFKVAKILMHKFYNRSKGLSYDVALLKLESPATLNDFTNLACLPQSDPIPESVCTITGWGKLKEDGEQPEKLQVLHVPLISREDCEGYYLGKIDKSMLCAGFPEGGKDSCQGDSGGPMVCKGPDGRYSVHGVISWGYGCARPESPTVYARVSVLAQWIEEKIRDN